MLAGYPNGRSGLPSRRGPPRPAGGRCDQTLVGAPLPCHLTDASVGGRMEPSPDDPLPQAELYERHFPRLLALAISEYHIPASRAGPPVHDLLLAPLLRPPPPA